MRNFTNIQQKYLYPMIEILEIILRTVPDPPKQKIVDAKNTIQQHLNDPRVYQSLGEQQYSEILEYMQSIDDDFGWGDMGVERDM